MADALASIQVVAEFVIESALVSAVDRSIGLLGKRIIHASLEMQRKLARAVPVEPGRRSYMHEPR